MTSAHMVISGGGSGGLEVSSPPNNDIGGAQPLLNNNRYSTIVIPCTGKKRVESFRNHCVVLHGVESVPKIEIFYEGEIFHDIPR